MTKTEETAASGTEAPPRDRVHDRRWYTLGVLCLTMLVTVVDSSIVNVALPTFVKELRAGTGELEWIVDSYTLTFSALLLVAGNIGDRIGRHRALSTGMVIVGLGSVGAAFADSSAQLIAARVVMGVGAALIMPATMAIIFTVFTDAAERGKALALWSAVSGAGIALGPTLGGWLIEHYFWGSIFLINVPVIAFALVAGYLLVPASNNPWRSPLDPVGAVLGTAAFAALTYTIIHAGESGWTAVSTGHFALDSAALLIAFFTWEARHPHPMLDLGLFRERAYSAASGTIMILFFGLAGSSFLLTQVYQNVLGYTPLQAGIRTLPAAVTVILFSPIGGKLADRFGARLTISGGMLTVAGALCFFGTANASSGYGHYLIATVVMSAGMGLVMGPATNSVLSSLPLMKLATGSATNSTTRTLGVVLGVAVMGSVTTVVATDYSGAATPAGAYVDGVNVAVQIGAGLSWLAAVAAFVFLPRHRRPEKAAEPAAEALAVPEAPAVPETPVENPAAGPAEAAATARAAAADATAAAERAAFAASEAADAAARATAAASLFDTGPFDTDVPDTAAELTEETNA